MMDISEDIHDQRLQDGKRFYADLAPHADDQIFRTPEWQPQIDQWPLDATGLREVERAILQRPDWLHYYARFGWTSWNHPSECHYDKHKQVFNFYDVPAIFHHNGNTTPDRRMLTLTRSGEIVNHAKYSQYLAYLPSALELCRDQARRMMANIKYLEGTYYIRFGMWSNDERSRNFLITDRVVYEKGVSVYHCNYDFDDDRWAIDPTVHENTVAGTMQHLIYGNRPVFLVQGQELEHEGADGEPLLRRVKLIKRLNKNDVYCPGIFDPREEGEL